MFSEYMETQEPLDKVESNENESLTIIYLKIKKMILKMIRYPKKKKTYKIQKLG